MMVTEEEIRDALKDCYDPEIPVNIVDLGLIYDVKIDGDHVDIDMTLTSVGCPEAPMILDQVTRIVQHLDDVESCEVELVYEPPWSPEQATEEGRAELEMMGVPIPNYD